MGYAFPLIMHKVLHKQTAETDKQNELHFTRCIVLFPVISVAVCRTVSWLIGHLITWLFKIYFHDYIKMFPTADQTNPISLTHKCLHRLSWKRIVSQLALDVAASSAGSKKCKNTPIRIRVV